MPGLAEMHGHLPNPDLAEAVTENVLFLYVANGVTTVRGMQGHPSQIALRARIDRGELLGPRLVLGSPSMSGGNVASVEDAARLVRQYKDAGFDLLKVHEDLSPEVYDAIAATAKEIGIPFGGHVTDTVGLFHALSAGQTTIDHLDNYVEALVPEDQAPSDAPGLLGAEQLLSRIDESRLPQVVQATLDADASVVPTMVLWESGIYATRPSADLLAERSEVRFMPKDTVERWVQAVDERVSSDPRCSGASPSSAAGSSASAPGRRSILLGTDSPQISAFPVLHPPGDAVLRGPRMSPTRSSRREPASSATTSGELRHDRGRESADLILVDGNPLGRRGTSPGSSGVAAAGTFREEIEKRLKPWRRRTLIVPRHERPGGPELSPRQEADMKLRTFLLDEWLERYEGKIGTTSPPAPAWLDAR
jgi:hypothetical protein